MNIKDKIYKLSPSIELKLTLDIMENDYSLARVLAQIMLENNFKCVSEGGRTTFLCSTNYALGIISVSDELARELGGYTAALAACLQNLKVVTKAM